ncbi:uncharacterized protein LOC131624240 [Vicia villosa]|uniref:uncharacterized protein LOC131624240 n=1 Tax=Vicia villosa TaxID=3911 RepID=UPI00273C0303|nr:uncharacterized protein LOC131624240 [Vicia villosa]
MQTELPRGCKVPKFTTLSGDTSESTDEHIARCFTVVPEHELVEMSAGRLDYYIIKKLDTQYLRDMTQLAVRVRQVELLKAKRARASKNYKKERVAYVKAEEEEEPEVFSDPYGFEELEINLAELKEAPPYSCKVLTPSNEKNLVEIEKNVKFPKKTYTFDDVIQNAIKEGRIKFGEKAKSHMKFDTDPLHVAETNCVEPVDDNMVDIAGFKEDDEG